MKNKREKTTGVIITMVVTLALSLLAFKLFRLMLQLVLSQIVEKRHTAITFIIEGFAEVAALTLLIMIIIFIIGRVERKCLFILTALLSILLCVGHAYFFENVIDPNYRRTEDGLFTFRPGVELKHFFNKPKDVCKIDRDGLRECPFSDVSDAPTIALIGDSWVFGWRLDEDDTLCALLGNELMRRGLGKYRIKNYGIPGLNFSSYAKIAEASAGKLHPEWIFVGYLSYRKAVDGTDTDPFDMLYFIGGGHDYLYYRIMAALFGRETTKLMHQIYNRFDRKTPPGRKTLRRLNKEISALEKVAEQTNLVILCFYGPDEFTDALKQRIKRIRVVDFSLSENHSDGYVMYNDPHPTAKANRLFAARISDIINSGD